MYSDFAKILRLIRVVVLIAFAIYLVRGGTTVHYVFAGLCVAMLALTIYQIYVGIRDGL